jgi:hypothetical protein
MYIAGKYFNGEECPQNLELSAKYVTICVEKRVLGAIQFLYRMYDTTKFVPDDPDIKKIPIFYRE